MPLAEILGSIQRSELYVVHIGRQNGPRVATLTVDDRASDLRWTEDERRDAARYVHKLYVVPRVAPGLGSALLDWAGRHAAGAGAEWLRLDVWTENRRLRQYYEDQGFSLVRVVGGLDSGALYQRPSTTCVERDPSLIIVDSTTEYVPPPSEP
ncbi:N-acetyltransferase [Jiangella rhizosphaerae]|uniref:GNAT family N-acetyltransferase n=1 Tax=Jiangella rhizosphaerae TaxID=2293569 RepID=UPI0011C3FF68|nr:GNAT family N-acetyltransferase [Jiangella rhizosphaerae]